jgi:hypothetical protein
VTPPPVVDVAALVLGHPGPIVEGRISDRSTLRPLISGSGYLNPEEPHYRRRNASLQWLDEFSKKHQPELADPLEVQFGVDDATFRHQFRRWCHRPPDRIGFGVEHDFLSPELRARSSGRAKTSPGWHKREEETHDVTNARARRGHGGSIKS